MSLILCCVTADGVAGESLVVAFQDGCPGADRPESLGAVGAVLGKIVIGGVIDWVGAMAKAQGEDKMVEVGNGTGSTEFYKIGTEGDIQRSRSCLSIIRPARHDEPPNNSPDAAKALAAARIALRLAPEKALVAPDFYAEFEIFSLPGRQDMFALEARTLYLGRSEISSWGQQRRSVALSFNFNLPSSPDKPFASTLFRFADVPVGKLITREDDGLFSSTSGLMPAPPLTAAEEADVGAAKATAIALAAFRAETLRLTALIESAVTEPVVKAEVLNALSLYCASVLPTESVQPGNSAANDGCPPENYVKAIRQAYLKQRVVDAKLIAAGQGEIPSSDEKLIGLMNVTAHVDETRNGSAFWAAIGRAYDNQKADLTQVVTKQLIPSERRKAEAVAVDEKIQADNASDDLYLSYVDAQLVVEEAAVAVAALGDKATAIDRARANAELIKARIKLNKAARSALVSPLPYPELGH